MICGDKKSIARYLIEHVGTKKNLEGVVVDKRIFKVKWLAVAHVQRPNDDDPCEIAENKSGGGDRSVHQRKFFHSGV